MNGTVLVDGQDIVNICRSHPALVTTRNPFPHMGGRFEADGALVTPCAAATMDWAEESGIYNAPGQLSLAYSPLRDPADPCAFNVLKRHLHGQEHGPMSKQQCAR